MPTSTMLHVRLDGELKSRALATLDSMGLTAADAVRLLFHRIVAEQAFPLELKAPNVETQAAMAEADAILAERRARFPNADTLIADLDSQSG